VTRGYFDLVGGDADDCKNHTTPRPAHLAHGRWLGDFKPALSAFEKKLVKCCAAGEVCAPEGWDGTRPEAGAATEANTVRAELIRFLALGGDGENPVHEAGVAIRGGWIQGTLSLGQATEVLALSFERCHFELPPDLRGTIIQELSLSGSLIPGLFADRMMVKGGLFFRNKLKSFGEVRLLGSKIGSNFECDGSHFFNDGGKAISADGIVVAGSVFLRNGFVANGEVRFLGGRIHGDFECARSKFFSADGKTLNLDRVAIDGILLLRDAEVIGGINLSAAKIGSLMDGMGCWVSGGHVLDGLQYKRINGHTDPALRIGWLHKQQAEHLDDEFKPQPWEQLIKVLREMGHSYEAAEIAMAKQRALRSAGKINGSMRKPLHWLYGQLAGYGHRPIWTVRWMAVVWLLSAFFFHVGASYGYLGPGTPLLNSPALSKEIDAQCGHRFETPAKQIWTRCTAMPAEYTTFQPLIYSLDLILPLVDLQQERDWAPIVEDPPGNNLPYGVFLRWLMWFEILFGWMASLVLVAVLGRLVEKD
jgi:hypothetical protein